MKTTIRLLALLLVLLGYVGVGFFQVEPDERAVVLRLGQHVRSLGPGLHWRARLLETVERRRTNRQRVEFGFRTVSATAPQEYEEHPEEQRMLTGDQNVVQVEFVVQYEIRDLAAYLFHATEVEAILRDASQSAMRDAVARRPIEAVLREERQQVAQETRQRIRDISNSYGLGLEISDVDLQEVVVPQEVQDAFRDVANAQQDRARLILEAQGYADQVVPQARGEAEELLNEARAYREQRILGSQGESVRFNALLVEYRKAPKVTRERLYIETLEQILPGMEKIIIEEGHSERVLPYLPLGPKGGLR